MRVLVCDDHVVFGEAVAAFLGGAPEVEDVTVTPTAREALREANRVDVLVVDLDLRHEDSGLDLVEAVAQASPDTAVLVLTACTDPEQAAAAFSLGARGYLTKDCTPEVLLDAVRRVSTGDTIIADGLVGPVLSSLTSRHRTTTDAERILARLTPRELEVLKLLAAGLSRAEIARRLGVSPHTARTHLQRLLAKLSLHSQLEAAAYGRQLLAV